MGKRGPKTKLTSRTEVVSIAVSPQEKERLMAFVDAQGGTVSSALYPVLKRGMEFIKDEVLKEFETKVMEAQLGPAKSQEVLDEPKKKTAE